MYLYIAFILAKDHNLYNETRWDPLIDDKDLMTDERLDSIRSVSGFFDKHEPKKDLPNELTRFGDLSIITLNLFREVIYDLETIQSAENVRTILDEAHPTIMCLQGIDDTLLTRIGGKFADHGHYMITNIDKYSIEMLNGQKTYLPIIYDSRLVHVKNAGYFETGGTKKMIYASYIEVQDLRNKSKGVTYSVINIDMFSSFNDVVSAEFSNVVSDITSYKEVDEHPVFIAGGIGTLPPNVKDLIKSTYLNAVEHDENNKNIPETTVHAGDQDDGIQRDFILYRNTNETLQLKYARILRKFLAGDHYPVHAIFTYVLKDGEKEVIDNKKLPEVKVKKSVSKK